MFRKSLCLLTSVREIERTDSKNVRVTVAKNRIPFTNVLSLNFINGSEKKGSRKIEIICKLVKAGS